MKSITRFAKRALSLVLCLTMVMTTMLFFDIGITKSEAKVAKKEDTSLGDVLLYVPEAIYLRPRSDSWTIGSTSTFHFFVENTVTDGSANLKSNPSVSTSTPTTGSVYFQYDKAKDGSVQLSYRWLNSSLSSPLAGNGIRLGATDLGVNQNLVLSKETDKKYYRTTIIAANSKSPYLGASDTGCYIEWTVKFHDNADNLDKSVTAYTYVYKPYVVPIGAGGLGEHEGGAKADGTGDHWNGQISWITGFHSFQTASSGKVDRKFARYSRSSDGSAGFLPFQTRSTTEPINDNADGAVGTMQSWNLGDSQIEEKSSYATQDLLYFASTTPSYSYFMACQDGYKPDNWESTDSYAAGTNTPPTNGVPTNSTTFSPENFTFTKQDGGSYADSDDNIRSVCVENNGVASIVVDSSRYSNLAQIPNLGVGMMVTNDKHSDGGAWYVADYTGRVNEQPINDDGKKSPAFYSTALMSNWDDHEKFIVRLGHPQGNKPSGVEYEGVKYSGAWDSEITGSKLHSVKMANYNHDEGEEAILITTILHMNVTAYDKTNLRAAVANAEKAFANLGIYSVMDTNDPPKPENNKPYESHYYYKNGDQLPNGTTMTGSKFSAFIDAYKTASQALITVNGTITNPDTLATNLNNALSALESDTACRKTGKATQYNAGVIRNEDGSLRIIRLPNSQPFEEPYYLRDQVSFSAESYSGYHFLAMYKLESVMNFDALVDESYDVVMSTTPPPTDGNHRQNIRITQSNDKKTSFVQLGTVSTSTAVANFTNSSDVTYPYAYDTDISYIYFYEIDNGEVIFGNEFDFDAFRWVGTNQSTASIDHVENTVTLNTIANANDAYTTAYNNTQKGYMTLVPGREYEFSCSVKNNSSIEVKPNMFFFTLDTAPTSPTPSVGIGASGTDFKSASTTLAANGTGTVKGTLKVPAGRPYATIRVGTGTANASITFSDIVVRDITVFTTTHQTNNITMPDPLHKDGAPNASVTDFPILTRPGYQLAGWSTVREANGNGAAANIVTTTTVPANGNRTLYPVWQTNVIYDLDGGAYRKSSDPMQTSYQVEGRWGLAIGTSVPVSNKVVQGQTGWDSADVSYTYVPYKPGYNFKGWRVKDTSIDPEMKGDIYWPTQTVVTNSNVEFIAVWEAAPAVTLNATNRITSSSNDGNRAFYPGQVHFYKYTPSTNQYASAYTYNSEGDLEMQAFDNAFNFVAENDNYEYSYGIQDIVATDPMITMNLTAGETYYAGITMHSITGTIAGGTNFRIQEHTVKYTLLPNGGTINGSNQPQSVTGYSNVDTVLPSTGEKYGYDFAGWSSVETPAKNYDAGEKVPGKDNYDRIHGYTESLVRDIYITAQWSPAKFNVTYDGNKKANESTTPTDVPLAEELTYDSTFRVTDKEPKRDGYTFKGWALTPDKQEGETLYPTNEKNLSVATVNTLYDALMNKQDVKLYARWAPNIIIVRFNNGVNTAQTHTQKFFFDTPQDLDAVDFDAATYTVEFYNVHPKYGTETLATTDTADLDLEGWESNANVINPDTGKPFYYTNGQLGVINPNGAFGISDVYEGKDAETDLNAKWKGGNSTVNAPVIVNDEVQYILAGWADPTDETADKVTVDYLPGQDFIPKGDSKLYAVWYSTEKAEEAEKNLENFTKEQPVITGIKITDGDLTSEDSYQPISAGYSIVEYDTEDYQKLVNAYITAKNNFDAVKTSTNEAAKITANNNLLTAIKNLETVKNPDTAQKAVNAYIDKFKIEYADSVPESERLVDAGEYSVADMNLNHYTEGVLGAAKQAIADASTIVYATGQETINRSVITLARAYASKQTLEDSKTTYQLYETAGAINASGLKETLLGSEDITAVNYVYTGKGNYTYYCYTNTKTPKVVLTVDEATDATATVAEGASAPRVCYPTTVKYEQLATSGLATSVTPVEKKVTVPDSELDETVLKYLSLGLDETAADYEEKLAARKSKYATKAAMVLEPDFSKVANETLNATVTYTLKAHNDAFAGKNNENIKYAGSSALATGDRIDITHKADSQGNVATPENTITITFDYHVSAENGGKIDVNGEQVPGDEWLKQYHLTRTSGGASNWEMVKRDDAVYTIDDPTYGQNNFGSFTYTFRVGAANDFANCVLTSADLEDVKNIVKGNYDDIRSVAFTSAKATTRFAHEKDAEGNDILDSNGNPKVYVETVPAGTGLGFKDWPQTTWSYNYYPASNVYTYVHIVDRWGNVVDKVINTPNVDANAAQFLTQSVGDVTVAELGGSGIDTMSFSAQSFDIITDENSTFDGETYTTTGNTIKVYTGVANKKYNLTANDVATNASTGTATTDAEGYLTITVDDLAFDTMSGEMYTFTLNGKTINLYAEVEDVILSAEDVTVSAGETATVSITTTDAATMAQLVSESGTTATATTYTEDEDGNRVWQINVKNGPGSYEYEVRAKVDGKWITEGETVTVTVNEPIIFVGTVTAVEYTPSTSTRNEFMFTVTGRPDKIQVIEPDGGTRTYDRYHAKVVIVSYDEDGNMVGSMSRELCYEVWTIEMNVPADIELTAIARYGRKWSTDTPYKYTVVLATPEFDDEVYSMELASTEGRMGKVQATVITGLDVKGVRFVMDNDTTTTYYTATEEDGKLTYVGNAWMNHYGENIIIVKIRVNNAWLNAGELTYQAI